MSMETNENNIDGIVNKITRCNKIVANEQDLRYELYGIFTAIILSKTIFQKNQQIQQFLKEFNITYREYVFSSRTTIISRVVRRIEVSELEGLEEYLNKLNKYFLLDNDVNTSIKKVKKNNVKNNQKDYINEILKKYSRNNYNNEQNNG